MRSPTVMRRSRPALAAALLLALAGLPAPAHAQPVVTIAASDDAASEVGLDPGALTVTRSGGGTAQALTVVVTIGGSAGNGTDYAGIGSTITIPANETTATRTITPLGDNRLEGAETVVLTVAPDPTYTVGAPSSATVTIADHPTTVTLVASDAAASEIGLAPGEFTVTRSGGHLAQALIVVLTIGGSAGNGADYAGMGSTITIPANETTATRTITPLGDNRLEGAETVTLAVAASNDVSSGYLIGSPSADTVTIADDPATVTLVATDPAASEIGPDPGEFTVTRSGGHLAQALTVVVTIGGTAGNGADYAGIGSTITILANATTATRTITPLADANPGEGAETVSLTLAPSGDVASAYLIGAADSGVVTIADDATTPSPTLTPSRTPTPTRTATPTPAHTATATPSPTATATPAAAAADPFMAYGLAPSAGAAGFVPLGPLTLADRFRTAGYDVLKRGGLLAPADRNGGGTSDPDTHLLEYRVKPAKGDPRFTKRFDVPVANPCSDVLLQVTKPVSLLVPAARSFAGPIGAPDPAQHERDHYLCYAAKAQKTRSNGAPLPPLPKRQQVVVADQFQTRRYDLKAITKLCQPAAVTGSPVIIRGPNAGHPVAVDPVPVRHASDFLVCYRAKLAAKTVAQAGCVPAHPADKGIKILPKQPKHTPVRGVHVATGLGGLRVDTKKELELCIPSTSS